MAIARRIKELAYNTKKGSLVHENPTMWALGMVDICSLIPASREAVSKNVDVSPLLSPPKILSQPHPK